MVLKRTNKILRRIFFSILLLNIVIGFASNVNTTVDCFVVGRYIGDTAAAAMAIFYPLKLMSLVPMFLFVGGTNVVCAELLGEKEWEAVDRIYIISTAIMFMIQLVFSLAMYFAPGTLAAIFCFGRTEMGIQAYVAEYFKGIAFFAPCIGLYTIIMSILQLKGDTIVAYIALILLLVVNVVGDLVSVFLLPPSMYNIGFASFVSAFIALIVLFARLIINKKMDYSQVKNIPLHIMDDIKEVVKKGIPNCFLLFMATICGFVVNKCVLTYGDVTAMSGYSIYNSVREVFVPIASGLGTTTSIVVSFLRGEIDYEGVRFYRKFFVKYTVVILGIFAFIIYFMAPPIVRLFSQGEAGDVAILFLRCFAMGLPFFGFRFFSYNYTLAVDLKLETYIITFMSEYGFIALYITILGKIWAVKGIAWGFFIAEMSLLIGCCIYILMLKHFNIKRWNQLFFVNENAGNIVYIDQDDIASDSNATDFLFDATVSDMDGVMEYIRTIQTIKQKYNFDSKILNYIELAIEELGTHILHVSKKKQFIDIRLAYRENTLILSLRDTGNLNNPCEWKNRIEDSEEYEAISYKILDKIADYTIYTTCFDYNCFTMQFVMNK